MGDDDLDLLHVGHYRGDDYRRHGDYRCDCAVDRVPPPGGLVYATERQRAQGDGESVHPAGGLHGEVEAVVDRLDGVGGAGAKGLHDRAVMTSARASGRVIRCAATSRYASGQLSLVDAIATKSNRGGFADGEFAEGGASR
jgi:hypothetical protein